MSTVLRHFNPFYTVIKKSGTQAIHPPVKVNNQSYFQWFINLSPKVTVDQKIEEKKIEKKEQTSEIINNNSQTISVPINNQSYIQWFFNLSPRTVAAQAAIRSRETAKIAKTNSGNVETTKEKTTSNIKLLSQAELFDDLNPPVGKISSTKRKNTSKTPTNITQGEFKFSYGEGDEDSITELNQDPSPTNLEEQSISKQVDASFKLPPLKIDDTLFEKETYLGWTLLIRPELARRRVAAKTPNNDYTLTIGEEGNYKVANLLTPTQYRFREKLKFFFPCFFPSVND